tara:strand:+ start:1011 stop:1232 length:222 start_codon:yes stop_codon:yes gene_type:complete
MNHKEQLTLEDVLKAKLIMDSVTNLDDADGETLENIIELLGMTEQLTRQLVMGANQTFLDILIEEKQDNYDKL